jgi:hypothetical protein
MPVALLDGLPEANGRAPGTTPRRLMPTIDLMGATRPPPSGAARCLGGGEPWAILVPRCERAQSFGSTTPSPTPVLSAARFGGAADADGFYPSDHPGDGRARVGDR